MSTEEQAAAQAAAAAAAAQAAGVETPPAQPAQAPAPAAPAQPAAQPVQEPQAPTVQVSNDQQEQLKNFVTAAGFNADELTRDFMETGEVPQALYDKLVDQHGEPVANLLMQQMDDQREAQIAVNNETDKKMFSHIEKAFEGITEQSGADTWKELKTWAGENMKDQKDELNNMLAQGGLQAQMAIDHMIATFKASDEFTQPAQLESGEDRTNTGRGTAISKQEYNDQLRELLKTKSYDSKEVQDLQRRRMKAIQRGQ